MITLLRSLFLLERYPDLVLRRRAVGTYTTAALALLAALVLITLQSIGNSALTPQQTSLQLLFIGMIFSAGVAALWLTRTGRQQMAGLVLISVVFLAPLVMSLTGVIDARAFLVVAMMVISLSAFIIGGYAPLVVMALTLPLFILAFISSPAFAMQSWFTILGVYMPAAITHGILNYLVGQSLPNVAQEEGVRASERRMLLSEASNAVSQRLLAARLDMDMLIQEIVRVVRDTFADVNHAQIYLINAEHTLVTLAATTVENPALVSAAYGVGSLSLVGRVSIGGQSIIARDTDAGTAGERVYLRSGFLPTTHAEVGIPMRLAQDIVGVLDLHSANPAAFLPEDVRVFETLATQISVTIDNARLFRNAQQQVAENKRLYEQSRTNLREIERLNRQLTGAAWTEYLSSVANVPAFTINLEENTVEESATWTPTMAEASRQHQALVQDTGRLKIVSVPITVRGQVIGAMEFELDPAQPFSQEQLIIVQQAVERLGLTADNARLFEDTQRIAHREAMVNEISTRMQSMTSVDAVIATATQSLGDAIRATRIAVRLGHPDDLDDLYEGEQR
jgi:GAF domain-containing protein